MSGGEGGLLDAVQTTYWPMRYLVLGPNVDATEADCVVVQAWTDAAANAPRDGTDTGEALLEHAVRALLPRLQSMEAELTGEPGPAVSPAWFNPAGHRWAGWWDREPYRFDAIDVVDDATRAAAAGALAELPLTPRAVVVLTDVAGWPPAASLRLLPLDAAHHLALLHVARSHVRRALERLVDTRKHSDPASGPPLPERRLTDYDISCDRLVDLTTEYLEGAIAPRLRTTFEQHLVVCSPCIGHLSQLRTTVRVLAGLSRAEVPPPARAHLAATLMNR